MGHGLTGELGSMDGGARLYGRRRRIETICDAEVKVIGADRRRTSSSVAKRVDFIM